MTRLALLAASLAACGFPRPAALSDDAKGSGSGSGSGLHDAAPVDGKPIDGRVVVDSPMSSVDANYCYGASPYQLCMNTPPAATLLLTSVNTDTDCMVTMPNNGVTLCYLIADLITVPSSATVIPRGSRALVLAANTIQVDGIIDVGSHGINVGIASGDASCGVLAGADGTASGTFGGGGGGGGGGSPGAPGGGANNSATTAAGGAAAAEPTALHGGCAGGVGVLGGPAQGGAGGGAIALLANTQIKIAGSVIAVGAGGEGNKTNGGGGGGGAGGMIVLDAPTLTVTGQVNANGGGGGEGGGSTTNGAGGKESTGPAAVGAGGAGLTLGGDGGNGATQTTAPTNGKPGANNQSGGGGGGGVGFVITYGSATSFPTTVVSPTPIRH